jgi:hypothetical protein
MPIRMDASAEYRPLPAAVKARPPLDGSESHRGAILASWQGRNAQTIRTGRRGALRSTTCLIRPARVQTSGAPAGATILPIAMASADVRRRPDRYSPPDTTRIAPGNPITPGPDHGRAARAPPGTDRRQVAPRAGGRSGDTRPCPASRRRCTRRASSRRGTASGRARAGPVTRTRGLGCRRVASRPGRQASMQALVRLAWPVRARTDLATDIRVRPRQVTRPPGRNRGTTTRPSTPAPTPVTHCWLSATRPRT